MARRRQRHGARVSRTHATEGESNGFQNGSTINGDTNETSLANVTANVTDNLHNPSLSEGRKLVRVSKGHVDTMSQSTKNFYFREFKKDFVWDLEIETNVREAWDSKAS
ncbi:hypothetical protein Tco_0556823 [Tanacetum coccineum]